MQTSVYTDNRSSTRRDVQVSFAPEGLRLVDELGVIVAFWPYQGLNVVEETQDSASFRLAHTSFGQAFLTSEDSTILRRLRTLPDFAAKDLFDLSIIIRGLLLVVAGVLCYFLTSKAAEYLANPLAQVIPISWEQEFSSSISKRIAESSDTCGQSAGVRAMDKLVEHLTPVVGLPFPIHVRVTDDPGLHAYAISGGEIVVFRGLLESMRTPEDLAGVLTHELAHTADRHPIAGILRSLGLSFFVRTYLEDTVSLRLSSQTMHSRLVALTYSAEEEATARKLGQMYLERSGFRANSFESVFSRLQRTSLDEVNPFVREHLGGGVASSTSAVRPGASTSALLSIDEWTALQGMCSEVIPPQ